MAKQQKQVITQTYDNQQKLNSYPVVNFEVDRFESAIYKHGYNVHHHKALRCPCNNAGSNAPLPDCENCRGIGWFYVDKTATKALMQGIGNKQEYDAWSEKNPGTVSITTMYKDDVSYMDKFELLDCESTFTQILRPLYNGTTEILFAFTIYEIISVLNIYKFVSQSSPLQTLVDKITNPDDWDYEVSGNKIIFNTKKYYQDYLDGKMNVSVRYKHTPVYCVVEISREIFKARDKSSVCGGVDCPKDIEQLSFRGQPQKSVGRRLHYIWDADNYSTPSVFDNTIYQ